MAPDPEDGRILDGFLLLAGGGSASPDDLVSANLASLEIADVVDEDLTFFGHLDKLDISDNRLASENILQQIGHVPKLGTLSVACNSLNSLSLLPETLNQLHTLDLSFNSLQGEVLTQLSVLSKLVSLNLSSNCISLVPTETKFGNMASLEEVFLDNNDLVQFMQWRALDSLPQLKKLSLASNRIKRLKDDLPEFEYGQEVSYFKQLEDLDLAQNEIPSVDKLPVLGLFKRLSKICLSDNPCMAEERSEDCVVKFAVLPGVSVHAKRRKQWYLCGSGCFKGKPKKKADPVIKLDRKRLHRVASAPVIGPRSWRTCPKDPCQLYQEMSSESDSVVRFAPLQLSPESTLILEDDLTEAELENVLRERMASIDSKFKEVDKDPPSFMKKALLALCTRAGSQISEDTSQATQPRASRKKSSVLTGGPSELFNLTGVEDEILQNGSGPGCQALTEHVASVGCSPRPSASDEETGSPRTRGHMRRSASTSSVTLPTIRPTGQMSAGTDVRKALQALRTVSMSGVS